MPKCTAGTILQSSILASHRCCCLCMRLHAPCEPCQLRLLMLLQRCKHHVANQPMCHACHVQHCSWPLTMLDIVANAQRCKYSSMYNNILQSLPCRHGPQPMCSVLSAVSRACTEVKHHRDGTGYQEYAAVKNIPEDIVQ